MIRLPENFEAHARSGVSAMTETLETNRARAAAGHPPVCCQLNAEQTEAVAGMVSALSDLLAARRKRDRESTEGARLPRVIGDGEQVTERLYHHRRLQEGRDRAREAATMDDAFRIGLEVMADAVQPQILRLGEEAAAGRRLDALRPNEVALAVNAVVRLVTLDRAALALGQPPAPVLSLPRGEVVAVVETLSAAFGIDRERIGSEDLFEGGAGA